eukprot:XP_001708245.1 Hypothetical protein GL50803_31591 [Giardia lamblia ATCC 50803]
MLATRSCSSSWPAPRSRACSSDPSKSTLLITGRKAVPQLLMALMATRTVER